MRKSQILFLILGLLILWAGISGRLGVILAAIFTPGEVKELG